MKNFVWVIFLFIFPLNVWGEVSIESFLDRYSAKVGEQVLLTVEVTSTEGEATSISFPKLDWLTVYDAGKSTSSNFQMSMGGGKKSVTKTFTTTFSYLIVPKTKGTYYLEKISTRVGNKSYSSNPLKITVTDSTQTNQNLNTTSKNSSQGGKKIFFEVFSPENEVYVDQMIPLVFTVYSQIQLNDLKLENLNSATFSGTWKEMIPPPSRYRGFKKNIDGLNYTGYEIRKFCLFPINDETITIDPISIKCMVEDNRKRSRDFFDSFFSRRTIPVEVVSNSMSFKVKPLPVEKKPEKFTGTVGVYRVEMFIDKKEVEVGDALTLKVKIFGEGNIEHIGPPILPPLEGFTKYDPTRTQTIERRNGTIEGEVVYEYILVPKSKNSSITGPIEYNFFDPKKEEYVTIKNQLDLKILPSSNGEEDAVLVEGDEGKRKIILKAEDLKHIITEADFEMDQNRLFHKEGKFYFLQVLPLLIFLFGGFLKIKKTNIEKNPVSHKRKKALKTALQQLDNIPNSSDGSFFSKISKVLSGFLDDKFNCKSTGMTVEEIGQILFLNQIDKDLILRFEELLSELDAARFTPMGDKPKNELFLEAKKILRELEGLK